MATNYMHQRKKHFEDEGFSDDFINGFECGWGGDLGEDWYIMDEDYRNGFHLGSLERSFYEAAENYEEESFHD